MLSRIVSGARVPDTRFKGEIRLLRYTCAIGSSNLTDVTRAAEPCFDIDNLYAITLKAAVGFGMLSGLGGVNGSVSSD